MEKYIIKQRRNFDDIEKFEENSQNIIEIEALDYQRKKIYNVSEFNIYFSEDAILGLGTELIRLHMKNKKVYAEHLPKANQDYIAEGLGVCVSPSSADITFVKKNMTNIDSMVEEELKKNKIAMDNFNYDINIIEKEKIKEFILNESIIYGRYDLKDFSLIKVNEKNLKIVYRKEKYEELYFDVSIEEVCKLLSIK